MRTYLEPFLDEDFVGAISLLQIMLQLLIVLLDLFSHNCSSINVQDPLNIDSSFAAGGVIKLVVVVNISSS
jgi:hypothetical protein